MFRKSTNNSWIPPGGLNSGSFAFPGGSDPSPVVATLAGSRFPGLQGATIVHDNVSALKDSKTSVGTLFMGVYQLVKFAPAVSLTRGQLVFWDTLANNGLGLFQVTGTASASVNRAGVAIYTDANAGGNFGYIQVAGLANILFGAAPGAVGSLVIQATTVNTPDLTQNTVNTITDATDPTAMTFIHATLGVLYETTPTASAVNRVLMNLGGFYPNVGRG